MSGLEQEFSTILEEGDSEACFQFIASTAPECRRSLAKFSVKNIRDLDQIPFDKRVIKDGHVTMTRQRGWDKRWETAQLAVFSTATFSELKKLGWIAVPDTKHITRLAKELQPDWIDDWVEWLLNDNPRYFRLARILMQDGLCKKPQSDGYLLGMIETLGRNCRDEGGLVKTLIDNPDILQEDIWRLFEIEGSGEFSLAAHDKYTYEGRDWANALIELSNRGVISRDHLLDESLKTLERDFAQFRGGWFSRFHEALEPTLEERAVRAKRYLFLLGSSIPPTVTFALKALRNLDKKKKLQEPALLAHIKPALQARTKSAVNMALILLESAVKQEPDCRTEASRNAATALIHEATDVQKRAFDIIDKYGNTADKVLVAEVKAIADGISPSLRNRLSKWTGSVESQEFDAPPKMDPHSRISAPQESKKITPVADLADLIERFSYILEHPNEPIEMELVLDGLSRIGCERPEDWGKQVGPLHKRAVTLIQRHPEDPVLFCLAFLAICFTEGVSYQPPAFSVESFRGGLKFTMADVLQTRIKNIVAQLQQGKSGPLLSAPTEPRGFIAPDVLVGRYAELQAKGIEPHIIEQVLALLRLAPDGRNEALVAAQKLKGEFICALRFALGEDVNVAGNAPLWIAAARARSPKEDCLPVEKRHNKFGPDAATVGRYSFSISTRKSSEYTFRDLILKRDPPVPKKIPLEHLAVLFHTGTLKYGGSGVCGRHESLVRWGSTISPGDLDPYFSEGVMRIDLDWWEAQWEVRAFMEPMLDPGVDLGQMGTLLLALALAAREEGQKGLATEIFIMVVEDGRLDFDLLSEHMAHLLPSGYVKPARWAKTLANASRVSKLHAKAVAKGIQGSMRGDPTKAPRDLGALLELLYELKIDVSEPLEDGKAVAYLAGVNAKGKIGKFGKKLRSLG